MDSCLGGKEKCFFGGKLYTGKGGDEGVAQQYEKKRLGEMKVEM